MRHPASTYRQFSVQGATPLGLVVMLYDGAIAAIQRAANAIEARDVSQKCSHVNRALAIIAQLEGTLNFQQGGEVAQTLKSLYLYARAQLHRANLENSPQVLHALIDKLSTVREAWHEADRRPASSASSPAAIRSPGIAAYGEEPRQEVFPSAPAGDESPRSPLPNREPGSLRMTA